MALMSVWASFIVLDLRSTDITEAFGLLLMTLSHFDLLPQIVENLRRHLTALLGHARREASESTLKFPDAVPESSPRVNLHFPTKIDKGKKEIANFFGDIFPRFLVERAAHFVEFLVQFVENIARFGPIKTQHGGLG